jgi:hypothetical protein
MKKLVITAIAIAAIIAIMVGGIGTAAAEKSSGQQGVDRADEAIHDNPNALEHADEGFHRGTCAGGFGAGGFQCN